MRNISARQRIRSRDATLTDHEPYAFLSLSDEVKVRNIANIAWKLPTQQKRDHFDSFDQHFIYVSDFQASAREFDKKNFYVFVADVLN